MIIIIVAVVVGLVALPIAACYAKRVSSKAMILAALLVLIVLIWAYVVLALSVLSAHELPETVARWPSAFLLAAIGLGYFTAVAGVAFLRKQA